MKDCCDRERKVSMQPVVAISRSSCSQIFYSRVAMTSPKSFVKYISKHPDDVFSLKFVDVSRWETVS